MLLWELLSGRRHKNKEKARHNNSAAAEPATTSGGVLKTTPTVSVTALPPAALTNVNHQIEKDDGAVAAVVHPSASSLSPALSAVDSSPLSLSPKTAASLLLVRPTERVSFNNRTPDSIKLFKNSVLARRHSTSPGLLGSSTSFGGGGGSGGSGSGAGGTQRARRRRGEDAQRFSDRRRQHK